MVNMAILSAKALPRGHGVRPGVSLNLTRSATKPENQNKLSAFFKKAYSYTLKCLNGGFFYHVQGKIKTFI